MQPLLRTIRLPERHGERLLAALKKRSADGIENDRRDLRLRYYRGACEATLARSGGAEVRHAITPRSLSRPGFAFIHGQYVHGDTRCCIDLIDLGENKREFRGSVAQCQHLSGIIYEVTVLFDEPIDLDRFVDLDAAPLCRRSRKSNRQRLGDCTVALLDANRRRRDALKQSLRSHVGRVHVAGDVAGLLQALERFACHAVLLVAEPDRDPSVSEMLRSGGYPGHVMWLEDGDPPEGDDAANPQGENETDARVHRLPGPLTAERVVAKLEELFTADERSVGDGTYAGDIAPLRAVLQGIRGRADVLRESAPAGDSQRLAHLCRVLSDAAAAVGLYTLADTAHELTHATESPGSHHPPRFSRLSRCIRLHRLRVFSRNAIAHRRTPAPRTRRNPLRRGVEPETAAQRIRVWHPAGVRSG